MFDIESITIEVANFAAFTNKHGNRYLKRFLDSRVSYIFSTIERINQVEDVTSFEYSDYEMKLYSSIERTYSQIYSKLKTYGFSYEGLREYHDGRIEVDYARHYLYI